jgi:ABC-type thiamin/hydroxymethylpyrimidine transport system permease subunit
MPPTVTFLLVVLCAVVFVSPFVAERVVAAKKGPAWLPQFVQIGLAVQIAAVVAVVLILRPGHGTTRKAIDATLQAGTPVLVELYSNS